MKTEKIFMVILFNFVIIISELLFGFISNSFALISDALHNFGDVISLIVTYLTLKHTISTNMKAVLFNTIFLYITMIYLIYQAILNLYNPQIIDPLYMIGVGFIALVANGLSAYYLSSMQVSSCGHTHHEHNTNHEHQNMNIKSAYFHMLSDALISLGVVIAGIFIYYYQIYFIDSILTIIFSIYIIIHSYPLLKKSVKYFLIKENKNV
jgi:cobalt-zinc-cadmium efflux system protein